ncbi:MAG TPA: SH3 domain-containing protein [Candidatus Limnocylindria bacterium]|nr:SH3 domain-containing protein [Candidatus Limnocylindria bacterium]
MFDPDDIPLSTSEGRRPSSTAGDRMMVGLAIVALVGGLLIAVSRLLPEQAETSLATVMPRASAADTPPPTPRPTPSPRPGRTMTVDPAAALPTGGEPEPYNSSWIRLRTRVTLLSSPSSTAQRVGALQAGDAAHVYVPPLGEAPEGWLQVETPVSGWIFAGLDNDAMFERFPYRSRPSGFVQGLAAHPGGFTAFGYAPDVQGELLLTSSNGVSWQRAAAPVAAWGRSVAYGPAGWLMVGNLDRRDGTVTVVWQSSDAREWQPIGALPPGLADNVLSLAGSEAGYVMAATIGSSAAVPWFSADGEFWTERPLRMGSGNEGMRVQASALGFFAWSSTYSIGDPGGAFSLDGWTWSEAALPRPAQVLDVVADGDHLLALLRGPGGTRLWRGSIAGQQLTWSADDSAPFVGAIPSRMLSDGERVIVLGWDRADEEPLWWERTGASWQRHPLPSAFIGLPREAAGGPLGFVAVQETTDGGASPVFWHLGDGLLWTREASPVMPAPPPLTPQSCGPLPRDVLELLSIDPLMAADCFGDRPITIRAWSVACEGCYGDGSGEWQPAWLAEPTDLRLLHLSAIDTADWGTIDAVLDPSLRDRAADHPSRWVEVTGHYDDPAAITCRWTPPVSEEMWFSGTADAVATCRARFVVTAVHRASGP